MIIANVWVNIDWTLTYKQPTKHTLGSPSGKLSKHPRRKIFSTLPSFMSQLIGYVILFIKVD
jgi:hypothetical protein